MSYEVLVDGDQVGSISEGETRTFPVQAGQHRVQVKCSWLASPELAVEVSADVTTVLQCRSTAFGQASLFLRRSRYLELAPADVDLEPQRTLAGELKLRMAIFGVTLLVALFLVLPILGASKMSASGAAAITTGLIVASVVIPLLIRIPTRGAAAQPERRPQGETPDTSLPSRTPTQAASVKELWRTWAIPMVLGYVLLGIGVAGIATKEHGRFPLWDQWLFFIALVALMVAVAGAVRSSRKHTHQR